jgi:hypothetical protein
MKSKEKDVRTRASLKLRRMIEALCEGYEEFWHHDDNGQRVVNIYALQGALERWAKERPGRSAPAQSTLARNYKGETENFSPATAQALSDYFSVPKAIVTGDLEVSNEAWGMDINLTEIRWIMLMRNLSPDQRTAIYTAIRAMLPADIAAPRLPPSATPLLKIPKH